MAQDLRIYKDENNNELLVTAFIGKENKSGSRNWIQLTIRDKFIQLSPKQIKDLIWILKGRFEGRLTATGNDIILKICKEDGDLENVEE